MDAPAPRGTERGSRGLEMALNALHPFLLALLTILAAIGFALGANALVWRLIEPGKEFPGASDMLAALFSIYGILLSLVIVAVWDDYQRAREILSAEISASVDVARALEVLPAPLGPEAAREPLVYYTRVVEVELPAMEHGGASPEVTRELDRIWTHASAFVPTNEREKTLQEIALNRLVDMGNQRRLRLIANERKLPGLLWAVILVGGAMVMSFSPLLGTRVRRVLVLRLGIAGLIGLIIFTIYALEYPFRDPLRVGAFEIANVSRIIGPRLP